MDFLQNLKIFAIPAWVKLLIVIVVGVVGILNTALFLYDITHWHDEFIINSTVELLSVDLPIFVIIVILWKSETGISLLRDRTDTLLRDVIPDTLTHVMDEDAPLFVYGSQTRHPFKRTPAKILISHVNGDCYSDFVILAQGRPIPVVSIIRLEVNVRKVNFNICFSKQDIDRQFSQRSSTIKPAAQPHTEAAPKHNLDDVGAWLLDQLKHSTSGAKHYETNIEKEGETSYRRVSYEFNPHLFSRTIHNEVFYCLVASVAIPDDFLISPQEKLFFAQDLMFFLRSCFSEAPELFTFIPEVIKKHL